MLGDAPYVLPFEGARWAVRVTLADRVQPAAAVAGWNTVRADEQSEAGGTRFRMLGGAVPSARLSRDLDRLFSLLEAAGDALRAEEQNRRPDALGEARELLANALSWVPKDHVPRLWERIRAFVERETSAEIRRAWKGGGRG